MRISFILPFASLSGGVRVVAAYADALVKAGHDVTVVSRPQRIRGSALRVAVRSRLNQILGKTGRAPTPLLDFLGDRHVVLERFRPVTASDVPDADAVIATWWETARSVADLPASKGRKFYLIQDYETFDNLPADDVAQTYHMPLHKIAVSSYIRDCIRENHGVQDITVLPNAVDTMQFDAPPRQRNRLLTVGFLYHTHPRKQVELAIEAVRQARAQIPDLRVIAFGRADPAARFDFPDWITYHRDPSQQEIPGIYTACDAWLFPSRTEGFGLPLLEAMACRTPVLATPAGAAGDLIDGINGRILDPTPDAFCAAIMEFDGLTENAWRSYSDAAYSTAHAHSWQDAAARLMRILDPTSR